MQQTDDGMIIYQYFRLVFEGTAAVEQSVAAGQKTG